MRFLSLFSGIEAASVAWAPLGWECVAVAEIEAQPCAVLAHHYPSVPNLGDVTKITEEQIKALGHIDLVIFGSPCQDLSLAGQRKGFNGARSSLFFTATRIVQWARTHCGCRFGLWENVFGAFSSNQGRDFAAVVAEMAGLPHVEVPRYGWGNEGAAVGNVGLVEWSTLDAQWFGVAQRRRRVFALADFGDWANRPPILLERQSLRGDTPPSRETRKDITGTLSSRTSGGGGLGTDFELAGVLQPVAPALRQWLNAGGMGRLDYETETMIVQPVAGTLDASYGRLQGCSGQDASHGHSHLVPLSVALRGREGGATAELGDEVAGTQRASQGGGDKPHVLAPIAFDSRQDTVSSTEVFGALGASSPQAQAVAHVETMPTLRAGTQNGGPGHGARSGDSKDEYIVPVMDAGWAVRRLMPIECERLQGFPDGYTYVPHRKKPMKDGPRYKALGNSMAVPVIRWIGEKITEAVTYRDAT